jgi:UDP-N-acetylmuramoyl-tripeptide--D-alanyl-D-alanine ligase
LKIALAEIAHVMGAPDALPGEVYGYSIDSRTLVPGDLFFALRGENHDGHDYVSEVLAKGAAAAVIDRDTGDAAERLIHVSDTLVALQKLAGWARQGWHGKIVAVTGSAGKTTTKDIIATMLETQITTGRTVGNLNNHIGLPLSILRLPDDAKAAVLELGMNHAGEIRALSAIAKPDIAVVTNVGPAHIEAFNSIDDIAAAKREIIEELPPHGVAVLNADDARVRRFAGTHGGRTILYGFAEDADVRATEIELSEAGVRFRVNGVDFESALTGRHAIRNLLAGLAVSSVFDIDLARLRGTVRAFLPAKMRGERIDRSGFKIINDCYNSNPDAVEAMLDVLREIPARRHIAVLGEMLELGRWSEPLHRDVGRYAVRCGITVLVGIRGGARFTVEAAVEAGLAKNAAYFFDDPVDAGIRLRSIAEPGDAILFKGSRGTRVEKALEKFLE